MSSDPSAHSDGSDGSPDAAPGTAAPAGGRQRVRRVAGARRAKLTAAPGTTAEPAPADERRAGEADAAPSPGAATSGPNDERLRRDVPPHY
jgi:hypothetical protein